jgi:hypothetical protein
MAAAGAAMDRAAKGDAMAAGGSKNNPENKGKQADTGMETVLICTPVKGGRGLRKQFVQRPKVGR